MRYIFHISIPVNDLKNAQEFYVSTLGGKTGRKEKEWLDILLWGHQITLQLQPTEVLSLKDQGTRHFGVILPWQEWKILSKRLRSSKTKFLEAPYIEHTNTIREQAKFYLEDPSHNVIEVKTYRHPKETVGAGNDEYQY